MEAGLRDWPWAEKVRHFLWSWEEGWEDVLLWILEVDRMAFENFHTSVLGFVSESGG